jgi:high-affinity iron transporter
VISYNLYWIVVIAGFAALRYKETRGRWPLMKPKADQVSESDSLTDEPADVEKKGAVVETTVEVPPTEVGN